ncbi:MAG TPA: polysaccharide deacetylase family protein [Steroidobacteraceae bacterium]|nr:polysaccharide deacetylase family protein [Steroidobacteraceae bacterium]
MPSVELHNDTIPARTPQRIARRGRVQRLIEVAERFGLVRALEPFHDRLRATLTVLAYHRVMPVDALAAYPFDPELISATPDQFEWQMEYLRRHRNLVSLKQVQAHLEGAQRLPPAAVAVTFDDGFSDTYRYAFPVLKRFAIPATIFVTTGYVDSGEPFWFELAAYLALRVPPRSLRVEGSEAAFPLGTSAAERRRSLHDIQELLKNLPNARRTAVVGQWARQFQAQIEHGAIAHSRPISWSQVAEMAAAGIEFGSHTVTHPNLTRLSDTELEWELAESKRVLETRLNGAVTALAYPIGTRSAFDARVISAAERAGFRLGVSYIPGANRQMSLERYELRRHGVGLGTTARYFRALVSLPDWLE